MSAYYNEYDKFAAQWLRGLIKAGLIAPGEVDERSICDVKPDDLRGFTQCHFFAGIGVWSYALRRAGWPDDRSVWTGSCPCQPFSSAGKGAGFADERHLWPAFYHLISELRPATVLGEQVASRNSDPWVDLVHADMEALGYAFGCVPFPSAGIGAPHIRDRNYWVADAIGIRRDEQRRGEGAAVQGQCAERGGEQARSECAGQLQGRFEGLGGAGRMADAYGWEQQGFAVLRGNERNGPDAGWPQGGRGVAACGEHVGLADTTRSGRREERADAAGIVAGDRAQGHDAGLVHGSGDCRPGPTNGHWRVADWLGCRDGKWRPVEPGTFPLAHGSTARVGRLRAYGNAINAEAAVAFIQATARSLNKPSTFYLNDQDKQMEMF